jgi:ubiquinol-cytochrome c reductase cytochrome c subunit
MKNLFVAIAVLGCAFQSAAQPAQSTKTDRAAVANGQVVFMRAGCYTCHGTVGHGGAGARLAPNTLPLEAFETWVRNGTPGWSIASGMPAFPPTIVSDQELADVRAFLASLPPPRAVQDIPLLNQ